MPAEDAPRIYCSGPLFTPEEVAAMTAISEALEAGDYQTFLPHRDGIEAWVLSLANTALDKSLFRARDAIDGAIFALDVFQVVEQCDALVINVNGRVPDEGAVAEAAIAFSVGTPVVVYKCDARAAFNGRDNAMLTGLTRLPRVHSIGELAAMVARALDGRGTASRDLPLGIAKVVARGKKIWALVSLANRMRGERPPARDLVDQVVALSNELGDR